MPAKAGPEPARKRSIVISSEAVIKPLRSIGEFFAMSLDPSWQCSSCLSVREFLLQAWFVARVSLIPTLLLAIPFTVLVVFTLNILLVEFGAADFSGTGAATASVTQIGPVVTVLVVAALERPRCVPTWVPAPSMTSLMRCGSSVSTRS